MAKFENSNSHTFGRRSRAQNADGQDEDDEENENEGELTREVAGTKPATAEMYQRDVMDP